MPRLKRRKSSDSQVRVWFTSRIHYNCIFKGTELSAKKKAKFKLEESEDAIVSATDEESEDAADKAADEIVSAQPVVVKNTNAVPSKTSLYKPPTFEELQNLKEAEMLFQSNLLKLQVHSITYMITNITASQITELLTEIRPKKKPSLDSFLHTLRSILLSIQSTEPMDVRINVW